MLALLYLPHDATFAFGGLLYIYHFFLVDLLTLVSVVFLEHCNLICQHNIVLV